MPMGLEPIPMQRSKMRDIERDYGAFLGGRPEKLRFVALAEPVYLSGRDSINSSSTKRESNGRVDVLVHEGSSCDHSPDASERCCFTVASSSDAIESSISSA